MRILAISRCLAPGRFHFKGVLSGQWIREIRVVEKKGRNFETGADYILDLETLGLEDGVLRVKVVRQRNIQDLSI